VQQQRPIKQQQQQQQQQLLCFDIQDAFLVLNYMRVNEAQAWSESPTTT
jgi:chemotaxis signal transduction protein